MILFRDRRDAGQQLARRLDHLRDHHDVVVLGIPRGGIVVADEVARELNVPLDVFITHKIGAPFNPELAIGAVASDGTTFLDEALIEELGLSPSTTDREKERQVREIHRRAQLYRKGQPPLDLVDKTIVLTDDGVATGSTTIAALRALSNHRPRQRILAVPVAPLMTFHILERETDDLIVLDSPEPFLAVGRFYEEFEQVTDDQVIQILAAARERLGRG